MSLRLKIAFKIWKRGGFFAYYLVKGLPRDVCHMNIFIERYKQLH